MKEEDPLGKPFYRGTILVEKKVGKEEVGGQPATHFVDRPRLGLHSPPSTSSCSCPAQTTNQKHQKQGNFPSFFSKTPFIYIFHLNFFIL
jgi:hypothetical protein